MEREKLYEIKNGAKTKIYKFKIVRPDAELFKQQVKLGNFITINGTEDVMVKRCYSNL